MRLWDLQAGLPVSTSRHLKGTVRALAMDERILVSRPAGAFSSNICPAWDAFTAVLCFLNVQRLLSAEVSANHDYYFDEDTSCLSNVHYHYYQSDFNFHFDKIRGIFIFDRLQVSGGSHDGAMRIWRSRGSAADTQFELGSTVRLQAHSGPIVSLALDAR